MTIKANEKSVVYNTGMECILESRDFTLTPRGLQTQNNPKDWLLPKTTMKY